MPRSLSVPGVGIAQGICPSPTTPSGSMLDSYARPRDGKSVALGGCPWQMGHHVRPHAVEQQIASPSSDKIYGRRPAPAVQIGNHLSSERASLLFIRWSRENAAVIQPHGMFPCSRDVRARTSIVPHTDLATVLLFLSRGLTKCVRGPGGLLPCSAALRAALIDFIRTRPSELRTLRRSPLERRAQKKLYKFGPELGITSTELVVRWHPFDCPHVSGNAL